MSGEKTNPQAVSDEVFGKMTYKHSWSRSQSINWWGGDNLTVQVTAHAYTGDSILDVQRSSYKEFQVGIEEIIKSCETLLVDYVRSNSDLECKGQDLFRVLTPRNIIFQRDGGWGVLFDAEFDIENGVALYKDVGKGFKVGPQDDFL
jgi:hypothetical protein